MSLFTSCNEAQSIYRRILKAMTHPGTPCSLDGRLVTSGGSSLMLQFASCLMDHEVTFALTDDLIESTSRLIADRTGSTRTDWHKADFLFVNGGSSHGLVSEAQRGSLAFPDKGATIVYCMDENAATSDTDTARVMLSGPGVQHPIHPQLAGLELSEYKLLRNINSAYPLGVDAFLIKGNHTIMGLPRSTRIEVK